MELKTNSQLDLSLNKEDLIDILIDEELTKLETQKAELRSVLIEKQTEFSKISSDYKKKCDDALIKKYLTPLNISIQIDRLQYYAESPSTTVKFYSANKNLVITIESANTHFNAKAKQKYEELSQKLNKVISEIHQKLSDVDFKIEQITKSPRRIKAKLLTNFLKTTTEGKEILKTISSSEKKVLALGLSK